MNEDLVQIKEWLHAHMGQSILVEKQETGDQDRTEIKLNDVTLKELGQAIDDYVEGARLVLHGSGTILNGAEKPPLPGDQYEIALLGRWEGRVQGDMAWLTTDRAQYVLTTSGNQVIH